MPGVLALSSPPGDWDEGQGPRGGGAGSPRGRALGRGSQQATPSLPQHPSHREHSDHCRAAGLAACQDSVRGALGHLTESVTAAPTSQAMNGCCVSVRARVGAGCAGMGKGEIDGLSLVGSVSAQVSRMKFDGVEPVSPGVRLQARAAIQNCFLIFHFKETCSGGELSPAKRKENEHLSCVPSFSSCASLESKGAALSPVTVARPPRSLTTKGTASLSVLFAAHHTLAPPSSWPPGRRGKEGHSLLVPGCWAPGVMCGACGPRCQAGVWPQPMRRVPPAPPGPDAAVRALPLAVSRWGL